MKKFIAKINKNEVLRSTLMLTFLLVTVLVFGQDGGTHPGTDPDGMNVPIDGGILMALLAGGSLVTIFLKKKKKEQ